MKQIEKDVTVTNFLNKILKVSSAIPTRSSVDDVINQFYNELNIPLETVIELDAVLQSIGIDKLNKEGLEKYVSNLITKKSGLSVENSTRVMNGAHNLILNILERRELQEEANRLKSINSQREILLKKEIERYNQKINNRITAQNLLISRYKIEVSKEDLNAEQLIVATGKFLGTDLNRQKIKDDIEDLLNGNTNIIIEL